MVYQEYGYRNVMQQSKRGSYKDIESDCIRNKTMLFEFNTRMKDVQRTEQQKHVANQNSLSIVQERKNKLRCQ